MHARAIVKQGICPQCRGQLEYVGPARAWDDGSSYPVRCMKCPWQGFEEYKELFDGHTTEPHGESPTGRSRTVESGVRPVQGLLIEPPPREESLVLGEQAERLYRVVYVVDIAAVNPRDAAERVHRLMQDPQSWPPVLQVVRPDGAATTVDLCAGSDLEGGPSNE